MRGGTFCDLEHGIAHDWKQLHMLMPVDEIGRTAERGDKRPQLGAISAWSFSGCSRRMSAVGNIAPSGRKAPWRSGAKSPLSGRKGAVRVTCKPIANVLPPACNCASASASACVKLGATTITEVVFSLLRLIRSRIAVLTPGAMP
jgi:hypothetical protein